MDHRIGIADDGVIGPNTLGWLNKALHEGTEGDLIEMILDRREDFYDEIVDYDNSQLVFLNGWKNRISKLRAEVTV